MRLHSYAMFDALDRAGIFVLQFHDVAEIFAESGSASEPRVRLCSRNTDYR